MNDLVRIISLVQVNGLKGHFGVSFFDPVAEI